MGEAGAGSMYVTSTFDAAVPGLNSRKKQLEPGVRRALGEVHVADGAARTASPWPP